MKKALFRIFAAAIVLSMTVTTAFAAEPRGGRYFVDADGDGICDKYASGQSCGLRCGARSGCGNGFRGGRCG